MQSLELLQRRIKAIKLLIPYFRMNRLPIRRLSVSNLVGKNDRRTWKPYYNNRHGYSRSKLHLYFINIFSLLEITGKVLK